MSLEFKNWKLWHWLVLALVIRLYKVTQIHCIAKDGVEYIGVARSWLGGIGFHPVWPPLYPWLVSLLMRLGIEPELSGQLISVIFGVLTVALVYKLTKSIFSPRPCAQGRGSPNIAQVATIFSVFHPYLVRYSAEVLADSLFTFLIIAVVYCGWLGLNKKGFVPTPKILVWGAIFVGVGTAFAYLTKPEGMVLLVIISVWWLYGRSRWYKKLAIIFCAWAIFLVLIFPYLYSIRNQTGRWMISQKQSLVFSISLQEEGFTDEFLNVSPLEYAVDNPGLFFKKVGNNLLALLGRFPDAYHPFLFILLLIGLIAKWGPNQKKAFWYIFSFLITYFIGYIVFHPGRRYLVNWVPLTLFLAAIGYERITNWWKWRRAGTALLLLTVLILIPKTLEPIRKRGAMWKDAGFWIKEHSKGSVTVMAKNGRAAFYAQAKYILWDEDRFGEADYIVSKKDISNLKEVYRTPHGLRILKPDG